MYVVADSDLTAVCCWKIVMHSEGQSSLCVNKQDYHTNTITGSTRYIQKHTQGELLIHVRVQEHTCKFILNLKSTFVWCLIGLLH